MPRQPAQRLAQRTRHDPPHQLSAVRRPGCKDFEETRPALYFAADRWSHLPDGRRRDRRAANDAARPAPPRQVSTEGGRPERRAGWLPLGVLSAVAVTTVALLGAASATLDSELAASRQAERVASASH